MIDAADLIIARNVKIEDELARRRVALRDRGELIGPCPKCGGRDRFGVNRSKQIWNCRGCDVGGDVLKLVMHLDGVGFADAVATLSGANLVPTKKGGARLEVDDKKDDVNVYREDDAARTAKALKLWADAKPIKDTLAHQYLINRRITQLPPDVDESLRFVRLTPIPPAEDGDRYRLAPCLLCLVRNVVTDEPQGVMRIALKDDGSHHNGKYALGPIANGDVKLWDNAEVTTALCIGEGVETTLAGAWCQHKGTLLQPAWAVLNTNNMRDFGKYYDHKQEKFILHPQLSAIEVLTILVDNDPNKAGEIAAAYCAERWVDAGHEVHRLVPMERTNDAE